MFDDSIGAFLPLILVFVIFWFLLIRPQRQQMKRREAMLAAIRRNDVVITNGGIIGKVTKVIDPGDELEVEIASGVRVKTLRAMIADVRGTGSVNATQSATPNAGKSGSDSPKKRSASSRKKRSGKADADSGDSDS